MQKNPLFNLIDDNFIGFYEQRIIFCMQDFMKHPEDYISDKDYTLMQKVIKS